MFSVAALSTLGLILTFMPIIFITGGHTLVDNVIMWIFSFESELGNY